MSAIGWRIHLLALCHVGISYSNCLFSDALFLKKVYNKKLSYNLIMVIFDIEYLHEFGGFMPVGKLLRNKKCMMAKLENSIQKDSLLKHEWPVLMALLSDISNRLTLPVTRCRKLRLRTCPGLSAFELKSKHLRLYVMREDYTGIIMTIGGRKTEQKSDIQSLQKIILEYCQYRMRK